MEVLTSTLTGMQSALRTLSSVLLYPVLLLLILGVLFAVFEIGTVVVEGLRERRYFKTEVPAFLRSIKDTPLQQMKAAIADSQLLRSQQLLLLTLFDNRDLDEESRWALSKKLLLAERERTRSRVGRDETVARIAPMIGLMGTLIPLGPGIVAFGEGDPSAMSSAMLIAFDTTVAGLVVAVVLSVIARVRKKWYAGYNSTLEAGVTALLERMDKMTDEERGVQPSADDGDPALRGGAA